MKKAKRLSKKELPKSTEGYRKALQKYLAVYDGKLTREFERLYEELHIAGYSRPKTSANENENHS